MKVNIIEALLPGRRTTGPPPPPPDGPKSPFEGVPSYLKEVAPSELTREKRFYLRFVDELAMKMKIPKRAKIAVLGVGAGLESEVIASVLDSRLAGGEDHLRETTLQSIDISKEILTNLRNSTTSERVRKSLVQTDVRDLSFLRDNSYCLVLISSLLHEIQSQHDWPGVVKAFSEAERILAPDGYLVIREFHPPLPERLVLEFKTPLAQKFFTYFNSYFRRKGESEWLKEWRWRWVGDNSIRTSSTFAFEIVQHFRMLHNDYLRQKGESVFDFLGQWPERQERYTVAVPKPYSTGAPDVTNALMKETGKSLGAHAFTYFILPDSQDDEFLGKHFSCFRLGTNGSEGKPYLFPTERMLIIYHKLRRLHRGEKRKEVALEGIHLPQEIGEQLLKAQTKK